MNQDETNQDETFETQLAAERAQGQNKKTKSLKSKGKIGAFKKALKALKHPVVKPLVVVLGEGGSGGILPGATGYVIWTYIEEKKSGKNTNIAEYLVVGIPAGMVDFIGLFSLTGFLIPLSYAITFPCLAFLIFWGIQKRNKK